MEAARPQGAYQWGLKLPDNPVSRRTAKTIRFKDGATHVLDEINGPGCIRQRPNPGCRPAEGNPTGGPGDRRPNPECDQERLHPPHRHAGGRDLYGEHDCGRPLGEDQLHEDRQIRDLIFNIAPRAGISRIEIERFPNSVQITVFTSKPGIVIGRKGATVKEMRRNVQELTGTNVKLDVS